MKTKAFIKSAFIAAMALLSGPWTRETKAQSLEPFNPYGIFTPSVEAWQMTRYGNLTPSLYTGAMTFSLPLYIYEDPDISIPVSLEYSFDGYRPSQHSGTVGYGWFLNCGGTITREVRGVPDEGTTAPSDPGMMYDATRGWFSTCADGESGTRPSTLIWSYHRFVGDNDDPSVNMSGIRSYDAFSDIPALVSTSGQHHRYDMAPDIWHFTFLGHSGSFMMLEDGTFRVYDSDLPEGEVKVQYRNDINNPRFLNFVITDGRGYKYVFECGGWSKTYGEGSLDVEGDGEAVTSLHLTRIDIPGGRSVVFTYQDDQRISSTRSYNTQKTGAGAAPDYGPDNVIETDITGGVPISYATVVENETVLSSVEVLDSAGNREVYVQMTYAAAAANESSPSTFLNQHLRSTGYPQQLLRRVTVLNKNSETVEDVTLSQYQASSGVPKSFLSSVTGKRFGTYSFTYDTAGRTLPKNDTWETDHWGFWNGAGAEYLFSHFSERGKVEVQPGYSIITGPDSLETYVPPVYAEFHATHLFDQMLDDVKEASFLHSRCGALTKIDYPTGGSTSVQYEGNACGRRLNTHFSNRFVMLENVSTDNPNLTYATGGVRVSSITDTDGRGGEYATEFVYETSSGHSSGILMQMPRYVETVSYIHYGAMCNAFISAKGFCNACGVQLSRDPHIGYQTVKQVMPDGSYTVHEFVSAAHQWASDDRALSYGTDTKRVLGMYDWIEPDITAPSTVALPPVSVDKSALRGKPLSEVTRDASGIEKYRKEYTYSYYPVTISQMWYNTPLRFCVTDFTAYGSRVVGVTETLHGVTSKMNYTYNSLGQKTCEERISGSGAVADTLRTFFSYLHETVDTTTFTSAVSAATRSRLVDGVPETVAEEEYSYGGWPAHGNPKPTGIRRYAPDGTFRTTTVSYDGRFRPIWLDLPGNANIEYSWDGNNLASRTDNGAGNTTSFEWKDLVGLTQVKAPSGAWTSYTYDTNNRLHEEKDSRTSTTRSYDYLLSPYCSYIRTTTFTNAAGSLSYRDVTYYDGLGYPVQSLQVGGSPLGKTVATQTVYDTMHRADAQVWLPYVRGDSGAMELDELHTLDELADWYSSSNNEYDDSRPYAETVYETSRYGRPLSTQREGDEWDADGGHRATFHYGFNEVSDGILRLKFEPAVASGANAHPSRVSCSGEWPVRTLSRTRTTDENGSVSDTYTDASGRIVCTRNWTEPSDTSGAPGEGTLSETLYAYDYRDSLVLVVQPEGSRLIRARYDEGEDPVIVRLADVASNPNNDIYREFCFSYQYDGWGNLISEHIPGGGTVERTYDERNRLVLETNDLLRPRSIQTVYDSLDRVVQRRVVDASLLQVCPLYSAEFFPFPSVSGVLTGFVADSGVTETTDVETANVRGMLKSETFYPAPSSDGTAPTGGITRTRNYYYDYRGRTVQMADTDSDGWTARYSTKYDFAGNVIATRETHMAPGQDAEQHTLLTTNAYDSRGRLTAIVRELDGQSLRPVYYIYDELGRVSRRIIGDGPDNTGYVAFNYDIHGWVTDIEARDNLGEDLVFKEVLRYASTQKPGTAARWDGNIAEASFTNTDGTHTYAYTGMGRLTDAKHYTGASNTATNARTERNLSYDRNGNITALTRYDEAGTGTPLSFAFTGNRIAADTYDAMGNLTRNSRNGLEFSYNLANLPESVEGADGASLTYSYLSDGSKWRASANEGPSILYRGCFVYEDDGNSSRISSIAWDEGRISIHDVLPGVDSLAVEDSLAADLGVVVPGDSTVVNVVDDGISDEWFIRDHLGSVRAIVRMDDSGGTILELNEYMPFGTRIPGSIQAADNRHRFGGKEEQRYGIDAATGTPAIDLGLLDFGARYYDPFTCRWTTRDPMAGKYLSFSPYSYCGSNPIRFSDYDGRDWKDKAKGYAVGFITNAIPGTSSLRDRVTVTDQSDYNLALKNTDNAAIALGKAMVIEGGGMIAGGEAAMAVGGAMVLSVAGAPEGVAVAGEGAALSATGLKTAMAGVMLMANAGNNTSEGYDRGRVRNNSKNEKHGDNGRALSKSERQIKQLQDRVNNTPSRHERKKLEQTIKNIRRDADKKAKGEEHSRSNKH